MAILLPQPPQCRDYRLSRKAVFQDSLGEQSFAFPPARGRVNCLLVTPNFCPLKVWWAPGNNRMAGGSSNTGTPLGQMKLVKAPGSGLLRTVLTAERARLKEKMLPESQSWRTFCHGPITSPLTRSLIIAEATLSKQ